MSSIKRVSSLTSSLLKSAKLVQSTPARSASTSAARRQVSIGAQKKEGDRFQKEENAATELDNSIDKSIDPGQSSCKPEQAIFSVGKRSRWQFLVSLLQPNLNLQPVRRNFATSTSSRSKGGKDECNPRGKDDCKPTKISLDMPLTCVNIRKPKPPCTIPEQQRWSCCDRSMCLPCCCPVERPLQCKKFDIRLNTCPRKTYRIAAYSECNKRYGRKQKKKECCYYKRICYAGPIADREIRPLLHIKDRQALALGFAIKALCNSKPDCKN